MNAMMFLHYLFLFLALLCFGMGFLKKYAAYDWLCGGIFFLILSQQV